MNTEIDKNSFDYKDGFVAAYTGKVQPKDFVCRIPAAKESYQDYLAGVTDGYEKAVEEVFAKCMEE